MRVTLIDEREARVDTTVDDGRVLITPDELTHLTGWTLKPEGLCKGDLCVPLRASIERDGLIDVGAAASALGRSFVFDEDGEVGALAGDPMSRGGTASIDELELPDLDGNTVRMSDHAGRKRLLIAWASW